MNVAFPILLRRCGEIFYPAMSPQEWGRSVTYHIEMYAKTPEIYDQAGIETFVKWYENLPFPSQFFECEDGYLRSISESIKFLHED